MFNVSLVSAKGNYPELFERGMNIINEIKQNFSSISDQEIKIAIKKIHDGSAGAKKYPFIGYEIIIDFDKLQNISDMELKGLFSHELSHLEDYSRRSWIGLATFGIYYSISDGFRKDVERKTDTIAIEKGYGKELLAFREYRLKTGSENDKKILISYYLSPEEIKNLTER